MSFDPDVAQTWIDRGKKVIFAITPGRSLGTLDPRNELGIAYLASLYYWWVGPDVDSLGNKRRSRRDDASTGTSKYLESIRSTRI